MARNELFRDMAQLAQAHDELLNAHVRYEGDENLRTDAAEELNTHQA